MRDMLTRQEKDLNRVSPFDSDAFVKGTGIGERLSLDFRAEVFNLTNTPPLNAPNVVLGAPGSDRSHPQAIRASCSSCSN